MISGTSSVSSKTFLFKFYYCDGFVNKYTSQTNVYLNYDYYPSQLTNTKATVNLELVNIQY